MQLDISQPDTNSLSVNQPFTSSIVFKHDLRKNRDFLPKFGDFGLRHDTFQWKRIKNKLLLVDVVTSNGRTECRIS